VDNKNGELQPYPPAQRGRKIPDERLTAFLALYIEHDFNGTKACIGLGMTPADAKAHAYRYTKAIRGRLSMQQEMRRAGLDVARICRKLDKLMDAQEPKWNLHTKQWDHFENCAAQLEAIKQTARLLNLYPAEPKEGDGTTVNVIIDVKL